MALPRPSCRNTIELLLFLAASLALGLAARNAGAATDEAPAAPHGSEDKAVSTPKTTHPVTSMILEPDALKMLSGTPTPRPTPPPAALTAQAPTSPTLPNAPPQGGMPLPRPTIPIISTPTPTPTPLPLLTPGAVNPKRLDVNAATREELAVLPGLDSIRANLIVQFREAHGPFRSVQELTEVQGISDQRLELFVDKVEASPPKPRAAPTPSLTVTPALP
jgi:competence ComEA-like helix-hairpin-helix protein